jgi:O-antigen/teichoic acid export membrane protein
VGSEAVTGPNDAATRATAPFWRDPTWRRRARKTTAAAWGASALALAATVIAARALGPSGYGEVILAVSLATLISTFLDITLEEALVHHGARAMAAQDWGRLRSLVRTGLAVDVAIGVVVSLGIVLAAAPLASLVGGTTYDAMLVRLAALTTLAATANGTTGAVLLLAGRPELQAWAGAVAAGARLVLVVGAVLVGGGGALVLVAYAVATGIGAAVQGILGWRIARRHWPATGRRDAMRTWFRDLLPFGVKSSLTTSAVAAHNALVPLTLGALAGPTAAGVLDVALLPVSVAELASAPLRQAVFPEQARLSAEGRVDTLRRSIRTYTAVGGLIGLIGAAAAWFLLPPIIGLLYSDRFDAAVTPARILLVMAVLSLALGWAKSYPAAIGRPGLRTTITTAGVAVEVGLVALLARHGATGGATALSITWVLVAITWWLMMRRLTRRGEPRHA